MSEAPPFLWCVKCFHIKRPKKVRESDCWKDEMFISLRIFCEYILREIHIRFLLTLLSASPERQKITRSVSLCSLMRKVTRTFHLPYWRLLTFRALFHLHLILLDFKVNRHLRAAIPEHHRACHPALVRFVVRKVILPAKLSFCEWEQSLRSFELIYGADAAVLWISAVSCSAFLTVRHLLVLLCVTALY